MAASVKRAAGESPDDSYGDGFAGSTMTVSCCGKTYTFTDVVVGEVWLAGGQSNMEFELQNCRGGREFLENDKDPGVRFYYTQKNAYKDEHFYERKGIPHGVHLIRNAQNAGPQWAIFLPSACRQNLASRSA